MTLLAAVADPDRVLVAADSLELFVHQGYGQKIAKLVQVPEQDLVYGIYGQSGRDGQLQKFLTDSAFSTWGELAYKTPYMVEQLNIESAPHGFAAIVAGRLVGTVQAHAFGRHTLEGNDGASWFVGQNRLHAKVAWDATSAVAASMDLEERFTLVMELVVAASEPVLEPPLNLWRVTPVEGCVRVLPSEA